jgi:DNA primase
MQIPVEFYDVIRNHINLSDIIRQKISLTKKAGEYLGLCPFHNEKTPSFYVNDLKKSYYCFGCSVSGDVIKFISQIQGLSYKEAAIKLASDYNIAIPKLTDEQKKKYDEIEEIYEINFEASEIFKLKLNDQIKEYLKSRGLIEQTIIDFDLGYTDSNSRNSLIEFFQKKSTNITSLNNTGLIGKNEDGKIYELFYNRIIFPIKNIYNKIVGFGGRTIDDRLPKYLNSPETLVFHKSEILYGEHKAINAIYKKNYSILVEGYMDVIALHQAGFKEAVAALGTSVAKSHLEKLWKAGNEIIICLDGDEAGAKAAKRVINLSLELVSSNRQVSFINLPYNTDPDNIVRKNNGIQIFEELLKNRISLSEMIWHIEYDNKLLNSPEKKASLEYKLTTYCSHINDKILKNYYYYYFKNQIWQYSDTKRKKNTKLKLLPPNIIIDSNELEQLEYSFASFMLKYPEIILHEDKYEIFTSIDFQTQELEDFRNWFLEEILDKNICNKDEIYEIVQNTGFFDIFLILFNFGIQNFYNDDNNKLTILNFYWNWLVKKHHLYKLKQEFLYIIDSQNRLDSPILNLYDIEMSKIVYEISKIEQRLSELEY